MLLNGFDVRREEATDFREISGHTLVVVDIDLVTSEHRLRPRLQVRLRKRLRDHPYQGEHGECLAEYKRDG